MIAFFSVLTLIMALGDLNPNINIYKNKNE